MEDVIIYKDGASLCYAQTDGEIVEIHQELNGEVVGMVTLYIDELEKVLKFAKDNKN